MPVAVPAVRPHLAVSVLSADLILARDDVAFRPLAGLLFPLLLPLIDGRRTRFEIADALEGRATLVDVDYGLEELEREGVIHDRTTSPAADDGSNAWSAEPAVSPVEAVSATIVVAGRTDPLVVDAFAAGAEAEGVRILANPSDACVRIVLTTDYLSDQIETFNTDAFSASHAWLIAKPVGATPWVGPLFDRTRARPCWNCLRLRLRETLRLDEYLRLHAPHVTLAKPVPLVSARAAGWSGRVAARLLQQWRAGEPSISGLLALDIDTEAVSEHRVLRRSDCRICRTERLDDERSTDNLPALLRRHVRPITGIIAPVQSAASPGPPAFVAVADHLFGPEIEDPNSIWRGFRRRTSGGGTSDTEARQSAMCEALERYSGVFRTGDNTCQATFRELGTTALHPNEVMGFSAAQYADRQLWTTRQPPRAATIPEPFDDEFRCDWTALRSLTSSERAWLPTALCYFGVPDVRIRTACRAESNGCAAGVTRNDALARGFLELVERDAVGLWWHNRIRRCGVALDTVPHDYVHAVVDMYARLNRSLWVLDIQSDLGIPAFAALSARAGSDDEQLTVGFGAGFDPLVALRHAITELNLFLPEVAAGRRRALVWGPEPTGDFLQPTTSLPWRVIRGQSAQNDETRQRDEVERVVNVARQHGLRVFALDQTRADVGLPTMRVVVPGLCHFWRRLKPRRLYSVPVAMGWLKTSRREDEMNPSALLV